MKNFMKKLGFFLLSAGIPLGITALVMLSEPGGSAADGRHFVAMLLYMAFLLIAMLVSVVLLLVKCGREGKAVRFSKWQWFVLCNGGVSFLASLAWSFLVRFGL